MRSPRPVSALPLFGIVAVLAGSAAAAIGWHVLGRAALLLAPLAASVAVGALGLALRLRRGPAERRTEAQPSTGAAPAERAVDSPALG